MNAVKFAAVLSIILIVANSACAQIQSGTLIVIYVQQGKVVIAADSLVTIKSVEAGTIGQKYQCKILALGKKTIFAWSGVFSSAVEDASRAYEDSPAATPKQLAQEWGEVTANRVNSGVRASNAFRQAVEEKSRQQGGITGQAIFISSQTSGLGVYDALISYHSENPLSPATSALFEITADTCKHAIGPYCALGVPSPPEFLEYLTLSTRRVKAEVKKWPSNGPIFVTKKLVELGIHYDKTGTVGGRIDEAVLPRNGSVRWVANPNCN
jgi:hypothetical protein